MAQGIVDEFVQQYKESHKDVKCSYRGTNGDGIEVYETSEEVKKLPYKERQKVFHRLMTEEYRGRTAKFVRNGHAYYATFDEKDVNKNIYGDKFSDQKGWKAKINVGADGNIFELVENAKYNGSLAEKGKKIAAHQGVGCWDYFVKNVQIDDVVFDLTANVRKKTDGAFVCSIQLKQNKKIKASPPLGLLLKAFDGVPNASENRVTQTDDEVKMSARDSEYLSAVESGDMETAQRMVDEADKAAGYNEEVFHGMGHRHNIYKSGRGQYGDGVYFTYDKRIGRGYGGVVDHLYVKIGKVADYDDVYKELGKTQDQTMDEFV